MKISLAVFTPGGRALGERVCAALPQAAFTVFDKNEGLVRDWVSREFRSADALVFIGATGLVVRLIAGQVTAKDKDPAVLVLDEKGHYVIPLLSGHIGGANRLAVELATGLGSQVVITTATDLNGLFAIDEWSAKSGCVIDDTSRIKSVSGALLEGQRVGFVSDFPLEGCLPPGFEPYRHEHKVGVCIALDALKNPFPLTLNLLPRIAILGAGSQKGIDPGEFEHFVLDALEENSISVKSLRCLASIDLKREEPCLTTFAANYGLEFATFSAAYLNEMQGLFTGSDFVKEQTGVDNVCERAAVAAGGSNLLIRKASRDGMTLALGIPKWKCKF